MDLPISSDRVGLRPVVGSDYDYIFGLETSGDRLEQYRHRGIAPTPETFASRLWAGVLCQFMVVGPNEERLGLVACYGAEHRDRYAYVALVSDDHPPGKAALFMEGFRLFIDYIFSNFDFRKLYGEVLSINLDNFKSVAGRHFAVEGRLTAHTFYRGEWIDQYLIAIHANIWRNREEAPARAARLVKTDGDRSNFESFQMLLCSLFEVDPDVITPNSRLVEDLGMDSITMLELTDIIEAEDLENPVPEEAVEAMVTVGDAHHLYAGRVQRADDRLISA